MKKFFALIAFLVSFTAVGDTNFRDNINMLGNDIKQVGTFEVLGETKLDVSLMGPLRATAGVVSSGPVNLGTEVTGTLPAANVQYLTGVTSDVQTQLNGKEPSFNVLPIAKGGTNSGTTLNNNRVIQSSGGAIVEAPAITADRALISNGNGIPTQSATTATELGYVSGVTSSIQTQLNAKEPTITILPIAKGGTNSGTALTNGKVMFSNGGAVVESTATLNGSGVLTTSSLVGAGANPLEIQNTDGEKVNFSVLAGTSDWTFTLPPNAGTDGYFLKTDGNGNTTWDSITIPSVTLQDAYEGGNTINTNSTDGSVVIAGTEKLDVTTAGGVTVTGDIVPNTDNTSDIGSLSSKFANAYISAITADTVQVGNILLQGNSATITDVGGNIVLAPNTSGSVQFSTDGNPRGAYAFDAGLSRGAPDQVASGTYSVVLGYSNKASGIRSLALGGSGSAATAGDTSIFGCISCTASAQFAWIFGGASNSITGSGFVNTIIGGEANSLSGNYGTAISRATTITHDNATGFGSGGASVATGDLFVGNNNAASSGSADNNHLRLTQTSDLHVGRQTNQATVSGASNTLKLHTTNASNQSNSIGLKARDDLTASTTYTLPNDGTPNKQLTTDGSGNLSWQQPALGAGSPDNAVLNPSALSDLTGYADSDGGSDVTRSTTAAELPVYPVVTTGVKMDPDANTEYIRYRFTMPASFKNAYMPIIFQYKTEAGFDTGDMDFELYCNSQSNYGGSYTRFNLTTDPSPSTTTDIIAYPNGGTFASNFSSDNCDYYEARWVRSAGTEYLVMQQFFIGQSQLAQASPDGYLGELTGFGVQGNGSKVFTIYNKAWRRGDKIEIDFALMGNATASGSGATSLFFMLLPSGVTINTSALPNPSSVPSNANPLGFAQTYGVLGASQYDRAIEVMPDSSGTAMFFNLAASGTSIRTTDLNQARVMEITGKLSFPVAQWATSNSSYGQSNNNKYYCSTNGTWDAAATAGNTQTDVIDGCPITGALTGNRDKVVDIGTPLQLGERLIVQSKDGGFWGVNDIASAWPSQRQGTIFYGVKLLMNSATQVTVQFAQYIQPGSSASYAQAGNPWTTTQAAWRLVRVTPSSAWYNAATPTQLGLVKSNRYQQKFYSGTTSTPGTLVTISNLTIGKTYQLQWQGRNATAVNTLFTVNHNGIGIGRCSIFASAANVCNGSTAPFVATATTATLALDSGDVNGDGTAARTWFSVQELNNIEASTAF